MKALQIDFAERPLWRLPAATGQRRILAAAGVVMALAWTAVLWWWQLLEQRLAETTQAIALARQEIVARTPPPPPPLLLSEQQVVAINRIVEQLNTPWPVLLDGFERVAGADVALLQIEPDHRRRVVKGVAEAKDHQRMLDYLEQLCSVAPFNGAMVTRHEVNERDPNRPLRFMFEALLADATAGAAAASEHEGNSE